MVSVQDSLFRLELNPTPVSPMRKKLVSIALKRDSSPTCHRPLLSASRKNEKSATRPSKSPKIFQNSNSKSPTIPQKSRSKSPNSPLTQRQQNLQKFNVFISNLWKCATTENHYSEALQKDVKKQCFESVAKDHEKYLKLINELKCIKIGRCFPEHLIRMIEEFAVISGVCSPSDIKYSSQHRSERKNLEEIVAWFSIGRVKNIQVFKDDENLASAFFTIVSPFIKGFDKFNSACENFRHLLSNPGLAVKTIKAIPLNIYSENVEKGKTYLDLIIKSFSIYNKSSKYSQSEGINQFILLLEEIFKIFRVSSISFMSKKQTPYISSENLLSKSSNIKRSTAITSISPLKLHNIKDIQEEIQNCSPITVSYSSRFSKDENNLSEFAFKCELSPDIDLTFSASHKIFNHCKAHQVAQDSKNLLLSKFFDKNNKNCDVISSEFEMSDNTDISDNEPSNNISHPSVPRIKSTKVNQMLIGSRFFKRLEGLIHSFCTKKLMIEPKELDKYRNDRDYMWKKLDYIKANTSSWASECLVFIEQSDICCDTKDSLRSIKQKAILEKLNQPGYIDTILFKIQSSLEKDSI